MDDERTYNRKRVIAELYAFKLGIAPYLDGFDRFVDAVLEVEASDGQSLDSVYRSLARKYKIGYKSIARSITYAVYGATNACRALTEIIGMPVKPQHITAKFVIFNIAKRVQSDAALGNPDILAGYVESLCSRFGAIGVRNRLDK